MVKAYNLRFKNDTESSLELHFKPLCRLNAAPLSYVGDGGWKKILPIIQTHYTNHILSCGSRVQMYHNHHHLPASFGQQPSQIGGCSGNENNTQLIQCLPPRSPSILPLLTLHAAVIHQLWSEQLIAPEWRPCVRWRHSVFKETLFSEASPPALIYQLLW